MRRLAAALGASIVAASLAAAAPAAGSDPPASQAQAASNDCTAQWHRHEARRHLRWVLHHRRGVLRHRSVGRWNLRVALHDLRWALGHRGRLRAKGVLYARARLYLARRHDRRARRHYRLALRHYRVALRHHRSALRSGCSDAPARPPAGDWPMYGYNPQRTFSTLDRSLEEDTVLRLAEKWRFIVPNPSQMNSVTASPTVYDGIVYFGDWEGTFYAVDAVDGSLVWKRDLKADLIRHLEANLPREDWDMIDARGTAIYSTALAYNGLIYTGIGQLAYALDARSGRTVWKRNIMDPVTRRHGDNGAPFYSSPTVAWNPYLRRPVVYVGGPSTDCVRGVLYALDPDTGTALWSYFVDGGRYGVAGEYKPDGDPAMGGGIWTSPALSPDGRTAYITTSNACGVPAQPRLAPALIALHTGGGPRVPSPRRIRWYAQPRSHDVDDRAIANTPNYMANVPTPDGGAVDLVGYADKDGSYRAYRATDIDGDGRGDRIWRTDVAPSSDGRIGGGFVGGGTGYADGRIFAGSFLGPPFMHSFDAWTGEVAWQSAAAGPTFGGLGVANDMVFKGEETSPGVKIYDADDGAVLRILDAPEAVVGAPALVDRHVIFTLGGSRPWEGIPTNPDGVGVMAYVLPDASAIPPVDPNPTLPLP